MVAEGELLPLIMRIIWYKPHQAPDLYQPRYFPVALARTEDAVYLPTLDPVQTVEEALDQLFQDDLLSVDEFNEVLEELYEHREPGEALRQTTPYKVPVQPEQFAQAPGLRPFRLSTSPASCSVLVRDLRWLRSEQEEGQEAERRLGVWVWVAAYLDADLIDVDAEETYLADHRGKVIARLTEQPQGYRTEELDELASFAPDSGPREINFAMTLVFEAPPPRRPAQEPDVLHLALRPLRVQRHTVEFEFPSADISYPLIKDAGSAVVLVEGIQNGQLSPDAERRYLDDRNAFDDPDDSPYYPEHPVLMVAARVPSLGLPARQLDNWRSPVDLLMRLPLSVRLYGRDGAEITPSSATISVQSDQPDELEAYYHFCALQALPELAGLQVEVLTLADTGP